MDKEQKRRMAYQTICQQDEGQGDIEYTIQVSGDCVEIHQNYDAEWENESGTGPDIQHSCWTMSKDTLKKLIESAQWCIEKSEAFEKAHPATKDYQMQENQPTDKNGNIIGLDDILVAHDGNGKTWRYQVRRIDDLQGSNAVQVECLDPVEAGFERRWISRYDLWRLYEIEAPNGQ